MIATNALRAFVPLDATDADSWAAKPDKEIKMEMYDDDLIRFEADGAAPLPVANDQGYIEHDGARIWYATYGSGPPVILLHGGLGHSGNWVINSQRWSAAAIARF